MYFGACQCGSIKLSIDLPKTLDQYAPRQCDCDYCSSRNISYISDPDGKIILQCGESKQANQQGHKQAEFISCSKCDSVVAVIYQDGLSIKGAINSQMLEDKSRLKKPEIVSPKLLSAEQKTARWGKLWCDVAIEPEVTD